MSKLRLDKALVQKDMASTRSQAENFIKLGYVKTNGEVNTKPGFLVTPKTKIALTIKEQYVSRAALKLESVAAKFKLNFEGQVVLDVGSSTGGFTDYALRHRAQKVIAVDVGSKQMHPTLASDPRVELHEKTDIRTLDNLSSTPDRILVDVSFISLQEVLPAISKLASRKSQIIALLKPQFETGSKDIHKGVIKNETMRRRIMQDFESWAKKRFVILDKADSAVSGEKGNKERFYLLKLPSKK